MKQKSSNCMMARSLIKGAIHCILWILGMLLASIAMAHSESKEAYGLLTGWWFALYFGYIMNISLHSLIIPIMLYIVLGFLSVIFKWTWFYSGLPESFSLYYSLILIIGAVVFVSPIIINGIIKKVVSAVGNGNKIPPPI